MSQRRSQTKPLRAKVTSILRTAPLRPPEVIKSSSRMARHLRVKLLAGLFVIVPLVITYVVLRFLFSYMDGIFQPLLREALPFSIPGGGIIILVAIIYLAGLVGTNVIGNRIIKAGQRAILRVPIVSSIYATSKQLIDSFSGSQAHGFTHVVMLEYPGPGLFTIGFMTGSTKNELGETLVLVYIPTAPMPNSGWVALVPRAKVYDTDLTPQAAMRMVLSAGIGGPATINRVDLAAEAFSVAAPQDGQDAPVSPGGNGAKGTT